MARVMVMMSGGVDSSVAAARLLDAGHDVTGVTLKLWGGDSDSGCCSLSDVEDARRVAAQLDIPHYVFNFAEAFDEQVVDPYVRDYSRARTPNPCIECNRNLKFGRALERATALGFDAVATGHHARVTGGTPPTGADGGRPADAVPVPYVLRRGVDAAKDQAYVLYMLTQDQLSRTLLPVGALTKAQVREQASRLGLRTAAKAESMDVCFITRGDRERFIDARTEPRPGLIVDDAGRELGRHRGVAGFTVGQRRGLGVAAGERRYVTDVDAASATVTIGRRPDLLRSSIALDGLRWSAPPPGDDEELLFQTRAHGVARPGVLRGDVLHWREPQPRVAPGQAVVAFRGDGVVGGGIVR